MDQAKGGPDVGCLDPDNGFIYQPLDNFIDVIDTNTNKIVDKIQTNLPDDKSTKVCTYDPTTKKIWVGTSDKKVFVLDPETKQLTDIAAQSGMDEIVFDPASRILFLGVKAGVLEYIDMDAQKSAGAVVTEKNFHSLNVDTDNHVVYAYLNESNKINLYQENMDLIKK